MQHILSIALMLLFISSLSCTPREIIPPDTGREDSTKVDVDEYPIKVVWKKAIRPDTLGAYPRLGPILFEEKVVFSNIDGGDFEQILAYNKNNGELEWLFEGILDILADYSINPVIGNMLFILRYKRLYNINLDNGTLNWVTPEKFPGDMEMYPRFYTYNENVAIIIQSSSFPNQQYGYLVQLDLYSGEIIDTLMILHERPEKVAYYQHRNGNDWLLFINCTKAVDLYAYDLTGDSAVWVNYDINNGRRCGVLGEYMVYKDKVILSTGLRMLCYSLDDGSLAWEINRPAYEITLIGDQIVCYHKDKIGDFGEIAIYFVAVYDAETGRKLWQTEVTYEADRTKTFVVYKERLYMSHRYLQCLDFQTGEKLWKFMPTDLHPRYSSRYYSSSYRDAMVIDQETGYCYISDAFYALCLDLNQVDY